MEKEGRQTRRKTIIILTAVLLGEWVGRILGDDQDGSFAHSARRDRLPPSFKPTGTAADRPWQRTFIHIDTFAMKWRDPERVTTVLLCELVLGGLARAQYPPAEPPLMPEKTEQSVEAPCLQPSGLVGWEDYRGPLQKVVGTFARKLERKSAHLPHYKAGVMLCSLELNDKFALFVQDTFDPVSFLGAGFNAGIGQAGNQDPTFGPGAAGYGERFGAEFVGQTSTRFFTEFAYPAIFAEDPRYYRLGHGSNGKRFLHAVEHSFIAHRDNGKHIFNSSEWLGTTSGVLVNSQLHPGNERGFGPVAQQVGYSVLTDMGFDVLREFWPEIARKFKMPFRDRTEPSPPK